jgi:hypothetical protein
MKISISHHSDSGDPDREFIRAVLEEQMDVNLCFSSGSNQNEYRCCVRKGTPPRAEQRGISGKPLRFIQYTRRKQGFGLCDSIRLKHYCPA